MAQPVATSRRRAKGIQRIDLAYAQLASSEIARDINRDVLLEIIRTRQPVSRADLSRISGLQPSTASAIVEQLIEEQWITEGVAALRPRGRPPTMLSLNANMVIVVADIRPTQSIVAVVDLNGHFLNLETVPLYKDPARWVEKIITAMQRMIKEFPGRSFEGIGLSLPGRVDPDSQHLIFAPNLPWCDFDIKSAIEAKIPLQVEMDNAANACLLSELWFGNMDGVRNAVLVTITEGIGTAILANGQLVTGTKGLAGEFGHMCIDRGGPLCGCGRKGCWEMFASSRAAINFYCDLKPNAERPDIISLLNLAADGDASAIEALSRQAKFLAHGLLTIITALAPEVIHLNGGLTSLWDRFGPIVAEELANSILAGKPPRLSVTSDVELSRLRGAAALVLQRHSGSRRIARGVAAEKSSKRRNPASTRA